MLQSSTFFSSVTKIVELLSTNPELSLQISGQLHSLRQDLEDYHVNDQSGFIGEIRAPTSSGSAPHEDMSPAEKRLLAETKEKMTNHSALDFLEKMINDDNLSTHKLRLLAVIIAGRCGIEIDGQQFKSIDLIFKWFDDNWDIIEPFTDNLLVVNC